MEIRPAGDGDVAEIARIATANGDGDGANPRYVAHLRGNGGFLVAVTGDEVAGYCATRRIAGVTMLCDLFVDPARHGRGVGRSLLEAAFPNSGARFTFASQDPRAMPLYLRHGMRPRWPLLYLSGPPGQSAEPSARRVDVLDAGAAESLLTGVNRTADYAYWALTPGTTGVLVYDDDGAVAAAGVAGPDNLIHLTTAGGHDPAATLRSALTVFDAPTVRLCLPGPHPAVEELLRAHWRIDTYDHHMSSIADIISSDRVLSPSLA
ncbi:hypothetical protein Psi02_80020 [Planotetraspora silvatica]|uniref:N-acetyltransferase domain-containing protein n=1 Tax=Planotetraspora silvatica TaxID=234614 RepID=A0A8J3UUL5_9ACTN|nr:GNAT family N-acetyltransferase [Planotetraspora silvatica]GII51578.1 hypothetical protein Psi02_80020 [Planotetraspora silvatica]